MCGPLLSSALLSRGKIALGRLSTLFALYYLLEVILHCEECFGDWAAPGFPRAAACMIKKCASIFHSITGKTLSFGIFSPIKYYARAVWSHLHQSSGHFFVNHGNILKIYWKDIIIFILPHFFLLAFTQKLSSILCVDLHLSLASCRRPEQRFQPHMQPPVWASRCFGGCLVFSSHVEMSAARADATFAGRVQLTLCSAAARAPHTAHVSICPHVEDF